MADINDETPKSTKASSEAYTAPKLEVFGKVAVLTAGGTAGVPEGGSNAMNKVMG